MKQEGVFGKEVTVRKTMLDDCKGPKFEELLAILSSAVLCRSLANDTRDGSISKRLLLSNTPLDQKQFIPLLLAYRSSLLICLEDRNALERRWQKFGRVLRSKKEELDQRSRLMDEKSGVDRKSKIPKRTMDRLRNHLRTNWTGDTEWADMLLQSDQHIPQNTLLERPFTDIWKHACDDTLYAIRPQRTKSMLQTLERRVGEQNLRLEKWRAARERINIQSRAMADHTAQSTAARSTPHLDEANAQALSSNNISEDWTDIGEEDRPSNGRSAIHSDKIRGEQIAKRLFGRQNQPLVSSPLAYKQGQHDPGSGIATPADESGISFIAPSRVPSPLKNETVFLASTPPDGLSSAPALGAPFTLARKDLQNRSTVQSPQEDYFELKENERLAAKIVSSVMNAEPSPFKPAMPSLAERTRMSMAMTSPQKPNPPEGVVSPQSSPERTKADVKSPGAHETLAERTRQSMNLMSGKPRPRRKSTKSRPSNVYPINQFEARRPQSMDVSMLEDSLQEGTDADYEAVFKSRPRIAVSPILTPIADNRESISERLERLSLGVSEGAESADDFS